MSRQEGGGGGGGAGCGAIRVYQTHGFCEYQQTPS